MASSAGPAPTAAGDRPGPPLGPRPVTHALFDMDGLLLDTETCYTVAQTAVLARHGREFTTDLKAGMMGKTALAAAEWLIKAFDPPLPLSPEELLRQRDALLADLFPTAAAMPGASKLVAHLSTACGVPAAVATSSHARHFRVKSSGHARLFSHFTHVVTGCQVTHGKPHPEIFLKAAAAWGGAVDPAAVVVFEDAPAGVAAARAAGMAVVFVPDDRHLPASERDKAAAMADQTISSLEEWVPEEWGLPPYGGV